MLNTCPPLGAWNSGPGRAAPGTEAHGAALGTGFRALLQVVLQDSGFLETTLASSRLCPRTFPLCQFALSPLLSRWEPSERGHLSPVCPPGESLKWGVCVGG